MLLCKDKQNELTCQKASHHRSFRLFVFFANSFHVIRNDAVRFSLQPLDEHKVRWSVYFFRLFIELYI